MDELQKASDRFDLPSTDDEVKISQPIPFAQSPDEYNFLVSSPPIPGFEVTAPTSPHLAEVLSISQFSAADGHSAVSGSPSPVSQPEGESQYCQPNEGSETGEPAWLVEFDADLIDSLRGVVNFVD